MYKHKPKPWAAVAFASAELLLLLFSAPTLSFAAAECDKNSSATIPPGAIVVPLQRESDYSSYLAAFHPGTPPQKEWVKIDTGSPTYSFLNPRNPFCSQASKPCAEYGTFDNLTSKTSRYAGPDFNDELIDFGSGDFLNDTVMIGGKTIPNLYFGYINSYAFADQVAIPTTTICGLSSQCVNNQFDSSCYWAGPFLLPQLYNASVINRRVASFYLGPDEPSVNNSQLIIGGAYDRAKMGGKPFTVPMSLFNSATNAVNVTAVSAITSNGTTIRYAYGAPGVGEVVLMDTGNPIWSIPDPIWPIVYAALGKPTVMNQETGAYTVDCKYRNPTNEKLTVEMGSHGSISVPFSSLVTSYGNGTCLAFVAESEGLGPFGDPFLRSSYLIYDQDNFTITFSQVNYTTREDIVPLPNGGF